MPHRSISDLTPILKRFLLHYLGFHAFQPSFLFRVAHVKLTTPMPNKPIPMARIRLRLDAALAPVMSMRCAKGSHNLDPMPRFLEAVSSKASNPSRNFNKSSKLLTTRADELNRPNDPSRGLDIVCSGNVFP